MLPEDAVLVMEIRKKVKKARAKTQLAYTEKALHDMSSEQRLSVKTAEANALMFEAKREALLAQRRQDSRRLNGLRVETNMDPGRSGPRSAITPGRIHRAPLPAGQQMRRYPASAVQFDDRGPVLLRQHKHHNHGHGNRHTGRHTKHSKHPQRRHDDDTSPESADEHRDTYAYRLPRPVRLER